MKVPFDQDEARFLFNLVEDDGTPEVQAILIKLSIMAGFDYCVAPPDEGCVCDELVPEFQELEEAVGIIYRLQ